MAGTVVLSAEPLLDDAEHLIDGPLHGRIDIGGAIFCRYGRPSGQVDLDRTPGVDTALVGVHVLQVNLDSAEAFSEAVTDCGLDISPDRLGERFAIADMVMGADLEDHGRTLGGSSWIKQPTRKEHLPCRFPAKQL